MIGVNFDINVGRAAQGRNFDITIWRFACEACSAKGNRSTNSAFALEQTKTTGKLHRFGRPQDLPDAN
jgi:hypothetical protein